MLPARLPVCRSDGGAVRIILLLTRLASSLSLLGVSRIFVTSPVRSLLYHSSSTLACWKDSTQFLVIDFRKCLYATHSSVHTPSSISTHSASPRKAVPGHIHSTKRTLKYKIYIETHHHRCSILVSVSSQTTPYQHFSSYVCVFHPIIKFIHSF